ncbi:uracil-DNA glycosylase [Amorphus orientalis]|uniref:Type-5 uracil-DNA glycosylase n=1 Tax=Amorphus orientalis TaxID=649198 RepID=A0AAE3VQ71_9HYPH|nr:uracil-DNA glycosylase [Amorphus orientalis]MDQ0316087.1 uracil-DNA glycosylase family 4 [Amorphus orientalis]
MAAAPAPIVPASRTDPDRDCPHCPRLVAFRAENRAVNPDWFNAPVPSFGDPDARLLIVGLAPGLRGANRTGRPFTGDFAGDLLYGTLAKFGFSSGTYRADPDDGLTLSGAAITNAVRCVPPQNKPLPAEIRTCLPFLAATVAQRPSVGAILALGKIAHDAIVATFGERPSRHKFAHGAVHRLPGAPAIYDSYHCSRYNTNTGRLTPEMFEAVFARIADDLEATAS